MASAAMASPAAASTPHWRGTSAASPARLRSLGRTYVDAFMENVDWTNVARLVATAGGLAAG
jgi:hypothetical protein